MTHRVQHNIVNLEEFHAVLLDLCMQGREIDLPHAFVNIDSMHYMWLSARSLDDSKVYY